MNIYQKKIVKENDIFFFDDFAQQIKNNNNNCKTGVNRELPHNLNVRHFYGINSKLLQKKESEKNNRQFKSKSQIFTSSPLMDNIIPKEIKTIIIKLDNTKDQKTIEENKKNNMNEHNNSKKNFLSFFVPSPEKKLTRNKSVIINNKNDNSGINISANTIYKKSYCIDKQSNIKTNKERSTTAPKNKLNLDEINTNKIEKKLIKNISTPNINNIIDACNIIKNKNKNSYINTNVFQNININNNINNLNVLQYDLSISPEQKNNLKLSEILTSRNKSNKNDSIKVKVFDSMDNSASNKNLSQIKNVSKFNDMIDKMNNIFSTKNFNLYNNNSRYINNNNRNQFYLNKTTSNNILAFEECEKNKNTIKNVAKNRNNLFNAININENDLKSNKKMNCIYNNKIRNRFNKNKIGNKNIEKTFSSKNFDNIKDENIANNINIKNVSIEPNNKISKIRSIPLKLNNSLLCSISSK